VSGCYPPASYMARTCRMSAHLRSLSSASESKRTTIAELLSVMQRLNLTLVLHEELGSGGDRRSIVSGFLPHGQQNVYDEISSTTQKK
jgi:hypothetical protein